jgi:hypothetical protein
VDFVTQDLSSLSPVANLRPSVKNYRVLLPTAPAACSDFYRLATVFSGWHRV